MSGDLLSRMAESSLARCASARRRESCADLARRVASAPPPLPLRLHESGFDLIAEIKLRSPSAGRLAAVGARDVAERARTYAAAGAAALSVLTEPDEFDGRLEHLGAALAAGVPVMRKDFLVDPYQVLEARAAGASGVLVIVRLVDDARLEAMVDTATGSGLFVLLETFTDEDVRRARRIVSARPAAGAPLLVGFNARDLVTLHADAGRFEHASRILPAEALRVAESAIETAADAARVSGQGFHLALVGTALMRAADAGALVREMIAAGREAKGGRCASA